MHPAIGVQIAGVAVLLWLALPGPNVFSREERTTMKLTLRMVFFGFYTVFSLGTAAPTSKGEDLNLFIIYTGLSGLLLTLYAFHRYRRATQASDMPVSKIGAAAIGPVAVQGNVWPSEPLHSLFHKTAVARYSIHVRFQGGNGLQELMSHDWDPPFFVADDTGMAVVNCAAYSLSELDVEGALEISCELSGPELSEEQRARIRKYVAPFMLDELRARGITIESCFTPGFSFREWYIPAGAPIFVAGYFESFAEYAKPFHEEKLKPVPGASLFASDVAYFKQHPKEATAALDANHDGALSAEEWYRGFQRMAVAASGDFGFQPLPELPAYVRDIRCAGAVGSKGDVKLVLSVGDRAASLSGLSTDWTLLHISSGILMMSLAIYDAVYVYIH